LIRQFLAESLFLSCAGGLAGLLVARWTTAYLATFPQPFRIPLNVDAGLDANAATFAFALALVTGVIFGTIPAAQASAIDPAAALKSGESRPSARRWKVRDALVVAQVALSALLLTGAGLFLRTIHNAQHEDPTADPRQVLLAPVDTAILGYETKRSLAFFDQLLERTRSLGGVGNAALVETVPFGGRRGGADILVSENGSDSRVQVDINVVSPAYFETIGLPVVRGRGFRPGDRDGAPAVAVINEVMARRFWPGRDPVGQRFRLTRPSAEVTVAGVVRDGKFRNFRDQHRPCFYLPLAQAPRRVMNLEVRSAAALSTLIPAIRAEVRLLDPGLPLAEFKTLEEIREGSMSQERLLRSLLTGLGVLALLLAAIGIYGVLSFSVARRTREIGIRMAIGARPAAVAAAILTRSGTLTLLGLALGLAAAFPLTRLVATLLYGVDPMDPLVLAAISVALLVVAMAAAYLPARHASRVDPVEALRTE
jgi:putative ABC transport system permease protein